MIGASQRPTTRGDLRITSLQAGGLAGAPPIVAPPFTIGSGGDWSPIPGASMHVDFTKNQIFGAPNIGSAFSLTRASTGKANDLAGNWEDFGTGVLRRTNKGIRVEEPRTNGLRNPGASGAVVGTPGTLPDFWAFVAGGTGISQQVIGTGVENGLPYVDIRWFGTASGSGNWLLAFEGSQQIVAASGQSWTSTIGFKLVAGSPPVNGFFNSLTGRNSGGSFVEGNGSFGASFVPDGTLRRFQSTLALANAGSVFVRNGMNCNFQAAEVVDFTMRISVPQCEQGVGATSPIIGAGVAATRASDFILLNNVNSFLSVTQGWMFLEWEELIGPTNVFRRLLRYRIDGNNAFELNINTNGQIGYSYTVGGVAQCNISSTLATARDGKYKAAVRWGLNDFAARFSPALGAQPANDTSGALITPAAATFGIGNVGTDSGQPNDNIIQFGCGTGLKTDAELLALVA